MKADEPRIGLSASAPTASPRSNDAGHPHRRGATDGWRTASATALTAMHRQDGPPQTSSPAPAVVEPHGREPTSAALPCPNARLLLRTVDELTERARRADDALPEGSSARDRVRTSVLTHLDFIAERSPGWVTYQALAGHDPGDEAARVRRQAREAEVAALAEVVGGSRGWRDKAVVMKGDIGAGSQDEGMTRHHSSSLRGSRPRLSDTPPRSNQPTHRLCRPPGTPTELEAA